MHALPALPHWKVEVPAWQKPFWQHPVQLLELQP
jgi:hypothetical protein